MKRKYSFLFLTIILASIIGFKFLPVKTFHETTNYDSIPDDKLFGDYSYLKWFNIDWPVAITMIACISYISAIIVTSISYFLGTKMENKISIQKYISNTTKSEALKLRMKNFANQMLIALSIYVIVIIIFRNAGSSEISLNFKTIDYVYFPAIFFSISCAILFYYFFVDYKNWGIIFYKASIDRSSNLVYIKPIHPDKIILLKLIFLMPLFLSSVQHILYFYLLKYNSNEALISIKDIIYFIPMPPINYTSLLYIISFVFIFFNKLHKTLFEFLANFTPLKNDVME